METPMTFEEWVISRADDIHAWIDKRPSVSIMTAIYLWTYEAWDAALRSRPAEPMADERIARILDYIGEPDTNVEAAIVRIARGESVPGLIGRNLEFVAQELAERTTSQRGMFPENITSLKHAFLEILRRHFGASAPEPSAETCCIDDVAHANREPEDGRALFLRCDKHGRREKLADDYYPPEPPQSEPRCVYRMYLGGEVSVGCGEPESQSIHHVESGHPNPHEFAPPIDSAKDACRHCGGAVEASWKFCPNDGVAR
jgi:hypothetical protein